MKHFFKVKTKWNFILLLILFISCNQKGKIEDRELVNVKGVVTYFFNDNYGQKPDVGAEIYFLEKAETDTFSFDVLWCCTKKSPSHVSNINRILKLEDDLSKGKITSKQLTDSLLAFDDKEYNDRSNLLKKFISLMKDKNYKCIANGNGEFDIKLPKGKYFTLVKFSHREGLNLEVSPEDIFSDKQLNFEFGKSDVIL